LAEKNPDTSPISEKSINSVLFDSGRRRTWSCRHCSVQWRRAVAVSQHTSCAWHTSDFCRSTFVAQQKLLNISLIWATKSRNISRTCRVIGQLGYSSCVHHGDSVDEVAFDKLI